MLSIAKVISSIDLLFPLKETLSKLESFEDRAAFNNELLEYRTQKEKEIFELRSTINKLQSDLFNEQNKQTHEKK